MLHRRTLSAALLTAVGLSVVVLPAAEEKKDGAVAIEVKKDQIEFRHGTSGKGVTAVYHIAPSVAKPYFWPVNSPSGTTITRSWPMVKDAPGEKTDHPHQKSA